MAGPYPPAADTRSVGSGDPPVDNNTNSDAIAVCQAVLAQFAGFPGNSSIPADNTANATNLQTIVGTFPGPGLPPLGNSATGGDAANINGMISLCGTALLQAGTFWLEGPVVPVSGGLIRGRKGCSAAGGDGGTGATPSGDPAATVLRPAANWSTTYSTSGNITLPNGASGVHLRDFWVAGLSTPAGYTGPASLDGICTNGSTGASAAYLQNVGSIWNTGNGIAFYEGDGIHGMTCYAGNNLGHGVVAAAADCTFINVHAQANGQSGTVGDGFYEISANSRLLGCRADLNQNGFTVNAADGGGYLDSVQLIGCGTQRNNYNGLNVINSSTAGNGQRDPVLAVGCNFFGDGQNGTNSPDGITGGAGGGGYAGVAVAGRNVVQLIGTNVMVGTVDVTGGCPEYALATAVAGTGDVAPNRIIVSGGIMNAVTGLVNDAAGVGANIRWSPTTDQVIGGMYYGETPFSVRNSEFHGGLFGDGGDGAVTLDGSTTYNSWSALAGDVYTMSRDVYCTSLTVENGVTLKPAGYRIFCAGTVTINSGGTISANGNAGGTGGAAAGGTAGGGFSGSLAAARPGAAGGVTTGSAASSSGYAIAAAGAAGGLGTTGNTGGGGASANPFSSWYKSPYYLMTGVISVTAGLDQIAGGGGGGGGGGDGTHGGGGGGGGGGLIPVYCWYFINTGTVSATGGNGGGGYASGNCGGGGGGGGGWLIVYSLFAWTEGTVTLTGGNGGPLSGTGANGSTGTTGTAANVLVA